MVVVCLAALGERPVVAVEDVPSTDHDLQAVSAGTPSDVLSAYEKRIEDWAHKEGARQGEDNDTYALARLKVVQARLVLDNYGQNAARDERVEKLLNEARELITALEKGESPRLKEQGRLERAYIAPNDRSAQPYLLYVPESYDGTQAFGLLVYLHGYSPDLNRENWVSSMYPEVMGEYARRTENIVVMPFARSNTDFQGCGEDDVMHVIEKVEEDYRIDSDRIILSGYSMGGMGVWTIGGHYPHRFAGLVPMSSRADFYLWKGLKPEDIPPFKRKLAEQEFGANLLPNYRHLPIYMIHGSDDFGIPVEQSRGMEEKLEKHGHEVEYEELKGKGHFFLYRQKKPMPELVDWLQSKRRVRAPRRVDYRTYTLKYPRAYWVEIQAIDDWAKAAEVECVIGEHGQHIVVTTDNVSSLALSPPDKLIGELDEVTVDWNGEEVKPDIRNGDLLLKRSDADDENASGLSKTPALSGPVREVFSGPFVMVYGGSSEPKREPTSHQLAHQWAEDWEVFAKGRPKVLLDAEVDDEIIKNNNLIVFGTPANNEFVGKILSDMPVQLTEEEIKLDGDRYSLDDHGLLMIYPNPLNEERYVVLNAGVPWGKELPSNHKYDMIPDFIVYTDEKADDGTEANHYRIAGFFGQKWELNDDSTWHSDDIEPGENK